VLKTVFPAMPLPGFPTEVAAMAPVAESTGRIAGEFPNNQSNTTMHCGGSGILRKRNR
jgi:hypothetical protein